MPFELNWRIFRDEVGGPGLGWMSPAWARRVGSQGRDDFLLAGMVVWIDAESSVVEMRVEFGGLGGSTGPRPGKAVGESDVPLHQRRS